MLPAMNDLIILTNGDAQNSVSLPQGGKELLISFISFPTGNQVRVYIKSKVFIFFL